MTAECPCAASSEISTTVVFREAHCLPVSKMTCPAQYEEMSLFPLSTEPSKHPICNSKSAYGPEVQIKTGCNCSDSTATLLAPRGTCKIEARESCESKNTCFQRNEVMGLQWQWTMFCLGETDGPSNGCCVSHTCCQNSCRNWCKGSPATR